jgi:glutathione S-transferase
VTNKAMGFELTPDKEMSAGYGNYDRVVAALDGLLSSRDYVCGDRFTAADVYVGATINWGTQFGTLPPLDSFLAYSGRVTARPAYTKAKAIDTALIAEAAAAKAQAEASKQE